LNHLFVCHGFLLSAYFLFSCLYESHFAQATQVSFGLAEVGGEERLDEVPSDG
jgi:hypothetical protein